VTRDFAADFLHVTSRGVDRRTVFEDDEDRQRFMLLLAREVRERRIRCLNYCLMGNHYHLVVEVLEAPIGDVLRDLLGDYVRGFNRRHVREGHLFERRFGRKRIETARHMHAVARDLAFNPVVAGLCPSPEEWRWSAHRELIGATPPTVVAVDAALGHFGTDREEALANYRRLVSTADGCEWALCELRAANDAEWRREAIAAAHAAGCTREAIATASGCAPRTLRRLLAAKSV
jgi:REP element-mobilizing transposase RayT